MNFNTTSLKSDKIETECLVWFVTAFDSLSPGLKGLDIAVNGGVSMLLDTGEFSGKSGQSALLIKPEGFGSAKVLLVGLGDKKKLTVDSFRKGAGSISCRKVLSQCASACFYSDSFAEPAHAQAVVEGYLLGRYKFDEFKSKDDNGPAATLDSISIAVADRRAGRRFQAAAERGLIIAEGQILARQLAATPGNFLTPSIFADKARKLARKHGLGCSILDEKGIAREKMGMLESVAVGSDEPARFIILEHKGGRAGSKPVVLIGKGVTFDSGGISLKAGLNMHEMKQDMSGAAAVVGAMVTAARLKLPVNVVGLVPATENMPNGGATKPGDIITSRKGLTVEIINTDAEGRLVLGDALDYACKFEPQAVIDIATLTGAAVYVLGYAGAPILGNNDKLLDRLRDAADNSAERVWELPLWDDFRDAMKSSIADLQNSAGRNAGTACAAAFLESFIGDYPWAHIDMAYMDAEPKGQPYIPKGATGYGVRLLIEVLSNWKKM